MMTTNAKEAPSTRLSTVRAPVHDLVIEYGGERYVGIGDVAAVVRVDRDRRLVFQVRRTPANKGKLAQRWPVSASIRIYTCGINRLFWPQPGTVLPLELVADAELAMAKLRQAADAEVDRMAAESVEA